MAVAGLILCEKAANISADVAIRVTKRFVGSNMGSAGSACKQRGSVMGYFAFAVLGFKTSRTCELLENLRNLLFAAQESKEQMPQRKQQTGYLQQCLLTYPDSGDRKMPHVVAAIFCLLFVGLDKK